MKCESCGFEWDATVADEYFLRCGYCEKITCESCGNHRDANMLCCPECFSKHDLEDVWVKACTGCGWVTVAGVVGSSLEPQDYCDKCTEEGLPKNRKDNLSAYTKENFQKRINNVFKSDGEDNRVYLRSETEYHAFKPNNPNIYWSDVEKLVKNGAYQDEKNASLILEYLEKEKAKNKINIMIYPRLMYALIAAGFKLEPENKFIKYVTEKFENSIKNEDKLLLSHMMKAFSQIPTKLSFELILSVIERTEECSIKEEAFKNLLLMEYFTPNFLFRDNCQSRICEVLKAKFERNFLKQHYIYFYDFFMAI